MRMTEQKSWNEREEEAKQVWLEHVRSHGIPDDIPENPDEVYAGSGWKGWQDWIGSQSIKGGHANE